MRNFQATCIDSEDDLNLTVLRKQSLIIMITIQIMLPILSKDARLPVQLQRAMAAEAEAAREARAKVGVVMVLVEVMVKILDKGDHSQNGDNLDRDDEEENDNVPR